MDKEAKLIQVQTSADTRELADKLASGLLESKLCACVKLIPNVTSSYIWKGEIQKNNEFLINIMTLSSKYDEAEKYILANHSYELPEIVATDIVTSSDEYRDWVEEVTK